MKRRKYFLSLLAMLLTVMFCLTGCGKKSPVSVDKFKEVTTAAGMSVPAGESVDDLYDDSEEIAAYAYVKGTGDGGEYYIEYYQMYDEEELKNSMASYDKDTVAGLIGMNDVTSYTTLVNGNENHYTLDGKVSGEDYYIEVVRVADTFIVAYGDSVCKKSVQDVLKKLGYR